MRCKQEFDRLVIKNGWGTIVSFVFITLFFSFSVVLVLTDGLTQKLSQPKSLGELGLVVFSLLFVFLGAWGMLSLAGYEIIIDSEGVRERRTLPIGRRRSFQWAGIGDWGYTFLGSQKVNKYARHDVYVLYFADIKLPMQEKNRMEKKVDRECIQFSVSTEQIKQFYPVIREYCCHYTNVEPFCSRRVSWVPD